MFKVNSKDTAATSIDVTLVFLVLTLNTFRIIFGALNVSELLIEFVLNVFNQRCIQNLVKYL